MWLKNRYRYIKIDHYIINHYIIMPNHIHLTLQINQNKNGKTKSLSSLIGILKSRSSKIIHDMNEYEFKWQKSFYDHVIKNEKAYHNIKNYIINNPKNWKNNNYFYNPLK